MCADKVWLSPIPVAGLDITACSAASDGLWPALFVGQNGTTAAAVDQRYREDVIWWFALLYTATYKE